MAAEVVYLKATSHCIRGKSVAFNSLSLNQKMILEQIATATRSIIRGDILLHHSSHRTLSSSLAIQKRMQILGRHRRRRDDISQHRQRHGRSSPVILPSPLPRRADHPFPSHCVQAAHHAVIDRHAHPRRRARLLLRSAIEYGYRSVPL